VTVYTAAAVAGVRSTSGVPWVEIDGDVIVATGMGARAGMVDLGDVLLAPGYVDIQVNGFGPIDFATAPVAECAQLIDELCARGVAACCPTVCSAPLDSYDPILERLTEVARVSGSQMIGVHLEGPFLGGAPGAHPLDVLRPVDLDWIRSVLDRFPGLVRLVTLAPEADPGFEATKLLCANGVTVAIGHSTASYDDAAAAADAGASVVTHVFNGMGPLHHRAPGLPGAALTNQKLRPSLIADFVHVHPALLRVAAAARPDLALVTDAVAIAGDDVQFDGHAAYLPDGTLAGSTLTMERAVQNMVSIGVPPETAIAMATRNPARAVGATARGELVAGARADVVALDPKTLAMRLPALAT
jgi:N-acetylglucosamine-6-phosphate deacetylase